MLLIAQSTNPTQSDAQPHKFWRGSECDYVCQSIAVLQH
jgi:hypothetical protein